MTDEEIREAVNLARKVMHSMPPDGSVTPAYKLAVAVELMAERLERAERLADGLAEGLERVWREQEMEAKDWRWTRVQS